MHPMGLTIAERVAEDAGQGIAQIVARN